MSRQSTRPGPGVGTSGPDASGLRGTDGYDPKRDDATAIEGGKR
jgi:hypothetical protein